MGKETVRCKAIVQVAGTPRDHVEKTLKTYIEKLKKDYKKELSVVYEFYGRAKKEKKSDNYYNAFAEIEVDFFGPENITWFCIDYLPASIEVLHPDSIKLKDSDFTNYLNDLLSKLHSIDMRLKAYAAQNELLTKNGVMLAKNLILVILSKGARDRAGISKIAGMPEDHAEKFLAALEKEGKIKKDGDKYLLP